MKTLLSISLLTISFTVSAQTVSDLGQDGVNKEKYLKEQEQAEKRMTKTAMRAREKMYTNQSLSEYEQKAYDWYYARKANDELKLRLELERKSDSIKKRNEELKYEELVAENNRILAERENHRRENERTYYEFAPSYLENFKIKYRDYLIKCYRENKTDEYLPSRVKGEIDTEYKKTYNMDAVGFSEIFSGETIQKVLTEVQKEFESSKEYIDGENKKNARLKAGVTLLNEAQREYNYNMTHLEKYSTPELRKIYLYFKDKKSFQTEAELVRIELLRRK